MIGLFATLNICGIPADTSAIIPKYGGNAIEHHLDNHRSEDMPHHVRQSLRARICLARA
jgi:hypothetical protein